MSEEGPNSQSSTIRVAHIFVCNVKTNSGDYLIGIATKKYFQEKVLNCDEQIVFDNFNCRDPRLYEADSITKLNEYDYIMVGGGGLILPDSAPNKISCWQWVIAKQNYQIITTPIYVISIGFNLFYGQKMTMPNRENAHQDPTRTNIFTENISALINCAEHFSMRHQGDVEKLEELMGSSIKEKVRFEFCPTIWYVEKYWKPNLTEQEQQYIAIEIKDDRQWRRYHRIGKKKYYDELYQFVEWCVRKERKILYISHDGSKDFYNYLYQRNLKIPFLDNSCADERAILNNYSKIHTILCSAGHSQMISHGLGIRTISLISHPKLKHFCDDTQNNEYIEINRQQNVCELLTQCHCCPVNFHMSFI